MALPIADGPKNRGTSEMLPAHVAPNLSATEEDTDGIEAPRASAPDLVLTVPLPEEAASRPQRRAPLIRSHECRVEMPDGRICRADYARFGPRCHRFAYGAPVCRQIWISCTFPNTPDAIEQKARELAPQAFREAQQRESKDMARKTRPAGHPEVKPEIGAKTAARLAGQYAACVRLTGGRLLPVGTAYSDPDKAAAEIASGRFAHICLEGGQRLAVGICCRFALRWEEPEFLARFLGPQETMARQAPADSDELAVSA